MEAISYTRIRNNLARALDRVNEDRVPILITRQKGQPAILMSLEEYQAWEETLHLMRSPRNAARIDQSIRDLEAGRGIVFNPLRSFGRPKRSKTTAGGRRKSRPSRRASMR